jgi:hypothetical protein
LSSASVQEAKSASSLKHPNIITIHEIDQADVTDFIVMKFFAGRGFAGQAGRLPAWVQSLLPRP